MEPERGQPPALPTPPPKLSFRWVVALASLGLLACGGYLLSEAVVLGGDLGFPLDDSWIHLQFARNLAAGAGLVYNPGEPVTGSTAPLWTALLSLVFLLPGSEVLWTKLLGILCYLGTLHATFRFARELELTRPLAILATVLTLATGRLVWSALSGMEVHLFALLSLWGLVLHLRERRRPDRPPLSIPVLAVAVLARPEGALLLLAALVDRSLVLRRDPDEGSLRLVSPPWKRPLVGLGLGLLGVAGTLAFYFQTGGSLLPTTFSIKGSGFLRWLPEPLYLREIWGIFFLSQPWMTLLAPAGCLVLVRRLGTPRDRGLLPVLWLFGLPLAYSLMSPLGRGLIAGNFGRYYFPLLPVVTVLGALGVEATLRVLFPSLLPPAPGTPAAATLEPTLDSTGGSRNEPTAPSTEPSTTDPAVAPEGGSPAPSRGFLIPGGVGGVLALVATLVVLWPTVAGLFRGALPYAWNVANVQDSDVRMARFLAERLPPSALLAVNDIGAFKYFLPNRILDVVGIASPEAARSRERRMAEGATFYGAVTDYIARNRADYVAIFPEWLPQIAGDPRFEPLYVLPIRDNRTMGGDEIVLFKTPWTRYPLADAPRRPGDPIPVDELRATGTPGPPGTPDDTPSDDEPNPTGAPDE
jgi:hypothetical protein